MFIFILFLIGLFVLCDLAELVVVEVMMKVIDLLD